MKKGSSSQTPRDSARKARALAQRDAYISILQAAETLQRQVAELLRPADLSLPQYNVLRILRGASSAGLACGEIGDRLIQHDPDITRLVDRLEKRSLIERMRDPKDRRVVRTRISAKGVALLVQLDEPMDELHERQLGHITERRLVDLTGLLQEARERVG